MKPLFDFSVPSRQSYAAIPLIIYKIYKNWVKILLPILFATIFSAGYTTKIIFGLLLLVGVVYGSASFFRYTFQILGEELIIKKGVFKRSKMLISFDRIQSINFKQSVLHQALSVVELEIDTAGSKGSEFELYALSYEKAESLRTIILANKRIDLLAEKEEENTTKKALEGTHLFQLSFWDLLKVGLTQNHLKSALLPVALLFWIQNALRDVDINLEELVEKNIDTNQIINSSLLIIGGFIIVYAILSVLISLIGSIIKYFELRFIRLSDGFKVSYGLLTKKQITIKDNKVQLFFWKDNLLQKIPKIHSLQIKQASSSSVKQKGSSIQLAGLSQNHITTALQGYFKETNYQIDSFLRISEWLLIRQLLILSIMLILGIVALYYLPYEKFIIAGLVLIPFLMLRAYLFQKKKKLGINEEVIHIKGGHFADEHLLFQIYKVQGVALKQSPFQRRKKLASIVFYTAAGTQRMPYLDFAQATKIRDYVLMIIETDKRDWM